MYLMALYLETIGWMDGHMHIPTCGKSVCYMHAPYLYQGVITISNIQLYYKENDNGSQNKGQDT